MAEVLLALAWDHDAYWSFCRLLICKTQGKVFPVNQNLPWRAVFEYHCISNYESPSTQNAWLAIGDALVRLLEESRITEKRCKSKLCVSVWVRYPVFLNAEPIEGSYIAIYGPMSALLRSSVWNAARWDISYSIAQLTAPTGLTASHQTPLVTCDQSPCKGQTHGSP